MEFMAIKNLQANRDTSSSVQLVKSLYSQDKIVLSSIPCPEYLFVDKTESSLFCMVRNKRHKVYFDYIELGGNHLMW